MTFYFVGGEDLDFQAIGAGAVDTSTAAARRPAYSRCALRSAVGGTTNGWYTALGAAHTAFWLTARFYVPSIASVSSAYHFLALFDGSVRRLVLCNSGGNQLQLDKVDATGTHTTLASSSNTLSAAVLYKLDVQIASYGASATVNVYINGALWLTYTGDVTTDSSTNLSGFALGTMGAANTVLWSEVIVGTDDTRVMSLATLPATTSGNAFEWAGSVANISPVLSNEAIFDTSDTAAQIAQAKVTALGMSGTPAILAVAVSANALKGSTGPSQIELGVRTDGADYWSSDFSLISFFGRVLNIWEVSPDTSAAWTAAEVTDATFNIGMKSVA